MKTMLPILLLFAFFALSASVSAQMLVNKAWQDTTGNPQDTLSLQFTLKDGAELLTVGNTYATSDSEQLLITKYSSTGTRIWQVKTASPVTKRLIATGVDISNGYIYIVSAAYDSATSTSTFITSKINDSTGTTTWSKQYTPSFGGYAVPAAVREDSLGNVFVSGTEQVNDTSYEMTILKYYSSGTVQFTSHYDSAGLYSGAVGMGAPVAKDSLIAITGYSGKTFGTWDIVTMQANIYNGSIHSVSRVRNGSGAFISHPVALAEDGQHNVYVVGASEVSGPNVDIKLIKYDSLFNQVWVKTWGGVDSLNDQPTYMVMDSFNNLIVTGYTTRLSGEVDLLVAKYDHNGNLLWSKTANLGTGYGRIAQGNSVITDKSNIYVTGKAYNGSTYDIINLAYDASGNFIWQELYTDGTGGNDNGANVSIDNASNVYVSGTITGSSNKFITIQYQQWFPTACKTTPCPDINYTFQNGQITTAGTDTFVEFDIYASQNTPTLKFSNADIYLTYNTNQFGRNICDSSNITISRGTITSNANYTLIVTDTVLKSDAVPLNGEEVHLMISSFDTTRLYLIADTAQQLCHVKIKLKKRGNLGIAFDQFFMQNNSAFFLAGTSTYTNVHATGNMAIAAQVGSAHLYYTLGDIDFSTYGHLKCSIRAYADMSVEIYDADVQVIYNNLSIQDEPVISAAAWVPVNVGGSGSNGIYVASYLELLANDVELYVSVDDNNNPNGDGLYSWTTTPNCCGSTNGEVYFSLDFNVVNCAVLPMLKINPYNPSTENDYFDANGMLYQFNVSVLGGFNEIFCPTAVITINDNLKDQFKIYPNPISNKFTVSLYLAENSALKISMSSLLGQLVYEKDLGIYSKGESEINITIPANIASGIYFITLDINGQKSSLKILKD